MNENKFIYDLKRNTFVATDKEDNSRTMFLPVGGEKYFKSLINKIESKN